jgi:hypothetical protein
MREPVTETGFEKDVLHAVELLSVEPRRELASRVSGGIEVTLYWSAHDDSTSIELWQAATEETLTFAIAREQALDAFYHPFAYLPAAPNELLRMLEHAQPTVAALEASQG